VQQHVRPGRETEAVWLISPPGDGGRPHVVVVGGGFAGLPAVHGLRRLDGDQVFLPADIVVWASGVRVHDQVARWNVRQGRGGRMITDDHLRVAALNGVFAVGDIAVEGGDRALPQLAQPARQGGTYVAAQLKAMLAGSQVTSFEYRDKGTLATIGRAAAVADLGRVRLWGFPAWLAWLFIHLMYIVEYENRLLVLMQWAWNYLTWNRSARLITGRRAGHEE
jgi:NADH dehydrogenase